MMRSDDTGSATEGIESTCPICYENLSSSGADEDDDDEDIEKGLVGDDDEGKDVGDTTVAVQPCHHVFCSSCLQQHCQNSIANNPRIPILCPCHASCSRSDAVMGCDSVISTAIVKQLLLRGTHHVAENEKLWKRYQTCLQKDISCEAEHKQSEGAVDEDKQILLQQLHPHVIPCSHCGSLLSKDDDDSDGSGQVVAPSSCNHVVCPACGNDLCFACGTHEYLTGKLVRTCANCRQEYLDHRYDACHKACLVFCCVVLAPLYLAYGILSVLLWIVNGCCFVQWRWSCHQCCSFRGTRTTRPEPSNLFELLQKCSE